MIALLCPPSLPYLRCLPSFRALVFYYHIYSQGVFIFIVISITVSIDINISTNIDVSSSSVSLSTTIGFHTQMRV